MKVRKRSVPLDMLSIHHKGYSAAVYTHRGEIWVRVEKDGECLCSQEFKAAENRATRRLLAPRAPAMAMSNPPTFEAAKTARGGASRAAIHQC
jgi:hypothetical protein